MEESTATAGGSRDRIDVHQVLGTSLDGLVRAFRSGNTVITPKIAERLFDLWNEVPKVMLVLDATTLSINEQVILKAKITKAVGCFPPSWQASVSCAGKPIAPSTIS